jgi:hypothetical protein
MRLFRGWLVSNLRKVTTAVVLLLVLAIGAVVFVVHLVDVVRPTFNVVDGDARLTEEAQTGVATIRAINQYHDDKGGYPPTAADVGKLIPHAVASGDFVNGWKYYAMPNADGYVLARRLGWDPSLLFEWTKGRGSWIFDPGDGTPQKRIALWPGGFDSGRVEILKIPSTQASSAPVAVDRVEITKVDVLSKEQVKKMEASHSGLSQTEWFKSTTQESNGR